MVGPGVPGSAAGALGHSLVGRLHCVASFDLIRHHRHEDRASLFVFDLDRTERRRLAARAAEGEMALTGNDDAFKYDIAFSFVGDDEGLATQLNDRLQDRYRTFLYSKAQEQLT